MFSKTEDGKNWSCSVCGKLLTEHTSWQEIDEHCEGIAMYPKDAKIINIDDIEVVRNRSKGS